MYKKFDDEDDDISNHLFTVILFDDTARTIYKKLNINKLGELPSLRAGGTIYSTAFKEMRDAIELTPDGYTPIVTFMTDGVD